MGRLTGQSLSQRVRGTQSKNRDPGSLRSGGREACCRNDRANITGTWLSELARWTAARLSMDKNLLS